MKTILLNKDQIEVLEPKSAAWIDLDDTEIKSQVNAIFSHSATASQIRLHQIATEYELPMSNFRRHLRTLVTSLVLLIGIGMGASYYTGISNGSAQHAVQQPNTTVLVVHSNTISQP